jgi:hypothetical protein
VKFLFFVQEFLNREARKACAEPAEVSAKVLKVFLSDLSVLGGKTLSACPS